MGEQYLGPRGARTTPSHGRPALKSGPSPRGCLSDADSCPARRLCCQDLRGAFDGMLDSAQGSPGFKCPVSRKERPALSSLTLGSTRQEGKAPGGWGQGGGNVNVPTSFFSRRPLRLKFWCGGFAEPVAASTRLFGGRSRGTQRGLLLSRHEQVEIQPPAKGLSKPQPAHPQRCNVSLPIL